MGDELDFPSSDSSEDEGERSALSDTGKSKNSLLTQSSQSSSSSRRSGSTRTHGSGSSCCSQALSSIASPVKASGTCTASTGSTVRSSLSSSSSMKPPPRVGRTKAQRLRTRTLQKQRSTAPLSTIPEQPTTTERYSNGSLQQQRKKHRSSLSPYSLSSGRSRESSSLQSSQHSATAATGRNNSISISESSPSSKSSSQRSEQQKQRHISDLDDISLPSSISAGRKRNRSHLTTVSSSTTTTKRKHLLPSLSSTTSEKAPPLGNNHNSNKRKQQQHSRPRSDQWLDEGSSEDDDSHQPKSQFSQRSLLPPRPRARHRRSSSNQVVMVNRSSLTDYSGESHLILDDCHFACSTLTEFLEMQHEKPGTSLTATGTSVSNNKNGRSKNSHHLLRSASQAAVRLSVLLSQPAGRLIVWKDESACQAVLDMLGSLESSAVDGGWSSHQQIQQSSLSPYSSLLWESLTSCAHFVSLDCCRSDHSAFTTNIQRHRHHNILFSNATESSAILKLRRTVLQHPNALKGLVVLSMRDAVVQNYQNMLENNTDNHDTPTDAIAGEAMMDANNSSTPPVVYGLPPTMSTTAAGAPNSNSVATSTGSLATQDDNLSIASSVVSSSLDPAAIGRRRKRQKRLAAQTAAAGSTMSTPPRKGNTPNFSWTSPPLSSSPSRNGHDDTDTSVQSASRGVQHWRDQADKATFRVMQTLKVETRRSLTASHSCETANLESDTIALGGVSLWAVQRILTGKTDDNGTSCLDDQQAVADDDEEENPLIQTNDWIAQGGAVPCLAQAMTDTVLATVQAKNYNNSKSQFCCVGCMEYLHSRLTVLASLVDGACLFHSENRQALVEHDGLLAGLLQALESMIIGSTEELTVVKPKDESNSKIMQVLPAEIALECLRTLTSLTHDNVTASHLLQHQYYQLSHNDDDDDDNASSSSISKKQIDSRRCRGIEILGQTLFVTAGNTDASTAKVLYDCVTFCLNTLTNIVTSAKAANSSNCASTMGRCGAEVRQSLADLKIRRSNSSNQDDEAPSSRKEMFLAWLVRWLIGQTSSFQQAVLELGMSTPPSPSKTKTSKAHEANDDDQLVTVGNGFVLLACLMIDHEKQDAASSEDVTAIPESLTTEDTSKVMRSIRSTILPCIPGNDTPQRVRFITNTLRAFCNYYTYSVGDLSLAIIGPVKVLIAQLEAIDHTIVDT